MVCPCLGPYQPAPVDALCPPYEVELTFSAIPHRWQLGSRRGAAVLRQLAIRYRLWPRTSLLPPTTLNVPADMQNGNLINTPALRQYLDADAHRHTNTDSDSELMLNIFADNLQKTGKMRINEEDIFTALKDMMVTCTGAYACVAMLAGFGIIAFRDPNGIRPLGIATRKGARGGVDYLAASESVVAQGLGFGEWNDVAPGSFTLFAKYTATQTLLTEQVKL